MLLKSSYPVRQIFALLLLNCSNFGLKAPRAFGLSKVSTELGLRVSGRAGGGVPGAIGYGVFGAGSGFWRGFHFGGGTGHCAALSSLGLNTFLMFPNIQ